jgi:predicted SprT family Zn-dependent metalloprotease
MNLVQAEVLVYQFLSKTYTVNGREFNLSELNWSFKGYSNSVRKLGTCHCMNNVISLSKKLTEVRTQDEVEQTILHEIAHAIDFEIRGTSNHDYTWKRIAYQIGYKGGTTTKIDKSVTVQIKKWVAVCPTHGIIGGFTRKVRIDTKRCKKCGQSILLLPNTDSQVLELLSK